MEPGQRYHSLDDFLASTSSSVDGLLDDGWGASFPVKGREIEATVLFADISRFSTRTIDMSPAATLIFVQNFFSWITAEALQGRPGIVDKYIGDEIMVVFSKEFGSDDPFLDAVRAAAAMCKEDVLAFCPHVGIASGRVIVGYAGTSLRYNVSVFGSPVALAARCASVKPPTDDEHKYVSSTIVMPAAEWLNRDISDIFATVEHAETDGMVGGGLATFELQPAREVPFKGIGNVSVREIFNKATYFPSQATEDRTLEGLQALYEANRYWPRWEPPALTGR